MYSVLLIDDEVSVRNKIRSSIDWEKNGFYIIDEAENGFEALEIIEEKNPDVVITDIKMPYMDGITLISELRKTHSLTTVIIISGYDEFSYAQSAIQLNVSYYALKPISREDFSNLLTKVKKSFDEKIESVTNRKQLEDAYKNALSSLSKQLLAEIYQNQTDDIINRALSVKLPCKQDLYMTAVIEVEGGDETINSAAVEHIISKTFSEESNYFNTILKGYNIITFFKTIKKALKAEETAFIRRTLNKIENLKKEIKFFIKQDCSIGISRPIYNFLDLAESKNQAICALNYKPYYQDYSIYYIGDLENRELANLSLQQKYDSFDKLIMEVKLGTNATVEDSISELFSAKNASDSAQLSEQLFKIITTLGNLALEFNIDVNTIGNSWSTLAGLVTNVSTIHNISEKLKRFCKSLNTEIEKKRKTSKKKFVEDAKRLIELNYKDPYYSLEMISNSLGVSEPYFSSIFKKECGVAFVRALTLSRMKHAKEMLRNRELKNYEIANAVGFTDPNYFSFCFKKIEGISPKTYRKSIEKL